MTETATLRLAKLQEAVGKFIAGDYPNPRNHRPGKCDHGIYYWEECCQCNDAFLSAALAESLESPPALSASGVSVPEKDAGK